MGQDLSVAAQIAKPITQVPNDGGEGKEAAVDRTGATSTQTPTDGTGATLTQTPTSEIGTPPEKPLGTEGTEKPPESDEGLEFAKKFEHLTKQEKALRIREEKLKAESEKYEPLQRQIELLKTNPLQVLKENGWTFKELAEMVLNDEKPTTEKQLEDLRSEFKSDREEREKRERELEENRRKEQEDREKANFERQVGQIKEAIEKLVEENEEEFELIKNQSAYDLVFDVISEVYQQTNGEKVITIKEAAERVEAFLYSEIEKNLGAKKFQSKFQKIEESKPEENELKQRVEEMRAPNHYMKKLMEEKFGRGLSNDMQAEGNGGKKDPNDGVYLTDDESKALLAEKLRRRLASS